MKTSMFKKRSRGGFTLIEIIIVVVILGILAAVALPKMTNNIDKARAAEAFQSGSAMSGAFQRCVDEQTGGIRSATSGDAAACASFAALNVTDPSASSNNFTYTLTAGGTGVTMLANGKFTGNAAADDITLYMNGLTGQNVKVCGGRFATMCKN